MTEKKNLNALKDRIQEVVSLNETIALMDWDMQTQMPEGAFNDRARQLSVMSKLTHQLFTADETGKLIDSAQAELNGADPESDDASMVQVARRDYERQKKLPDDLVSALSRETTLAHEVWAKARAENDFKSFAPALERLLELKKREVDCRGYTEHPYDALSDSFEPGLTTKEIDDLFAVLRKDLVPLVKEIFTKLDSVSDAVLHQEFDEDIQRKFAEEVITAFGYDFHRGRQDRSVHPFCTSFSSNDVRITTRFDKTWLNPALFGTLHESGHAMYEQGIKNEYNGTILSGGTSLGIHESQSRLWENVVGRSRGFWKHYLPILQKAFPTQLGTTDLDTFYRAINRVEPGFIRVEADECTYNLHIMLRFELEKALIEGSLRVSELPEAWNAKFKDYLGQVPPTDTVGVLQDVHWSGGGFGYFPTYTIGTLISAQLYYKAVEAYPSIPTDIEQGQFGKLLSWLRENVHQYGRKYMPNDLLKRATGETLNPAHYMKYLKNKFGEIYHLS